MLDGILHDPEVAYGMRVFEVREQPAPDFSASYRFKVAGPVLARARREAVAATTCSGTIRALKQR